MKTPVTFLIYNRPETTERVFASIRKASPSKLLIVADGSHPDRPDDVKNCAAARAIVQQVDWDCEVLKNYSDINLGCGRRISSGLDWVFDKVDRSIILEDDCLPHPSFFRFCDELLEKYKDNPRIMSITGTNILGEWKSNRQSYHFSNESSVWGWASWKRAWQGYDYKIKLWEDEKTRESICKLIDDEKRFKKMSNAFLNACRNESNDWCYPWFFHCVFRAGMMVVPSVNLISNIGFGRRATNQKNIYSLGNNAPFFPMKFPLKEPFSFYIDRDYTRKAFKIKNLNPDVAFRMKHKIKPMMRSKNKK